MKEEQDLTLLKNAKSILEDTIRCIDMDSNLVSFELKTSKLKIVRALDYLDELEERMRLGETNV
jgi:hypothetical protein